MSRERPTALLAGATGLVGEHLLRELTERVGADGTPAYRSITAVSRRRLVDALGPGALDRPSGVQVREVQVDFTQLHQVAGELEADHVYCALGTTLRRARSKDRFRRVDFDHPLTLARLALDAGARHFSLVSSIGANSRARGFYLKVKGETEEALREVGYPSVSILRPSIIGGPRRDSRPMEALGTALLSVAPARWRTLHARDVARCMVTLALAEAPGVRVVESAEIRRIAKR